MTLYAFADMIESRVSLMRHAYGSGWGACLEFVDEQHDGGISSINGQGATPDAAMASLAKNLAGKRIVIGWSTTDVARYKVPKDLRHE